MDAEHNSTAHDAAAPAQPADRPQCAEPRPWLTPEDVRGWRPVPRARGRGAPLIRVTVGLDAEQSAWLRQEAERTGLGYTDLVKWCIDERRTGQDGRARAGERDEGKPASPAIAAPVAP